MPNGMGKCVCEDGFFLTKDGKCVPRSKRKSCKEITCAEHTRCIQNENGRGRCICIDGYMDPNPQNYDGFNAQCVLKPPQQQSPQQKQQPPQQKPPNNNKHSCSVIQCPANGKCYENDRGRGKCICYDGFFLNGDICQKRNKPLRCSEMICGPHTKCIENSVGQGTCLCASGYKKDTRTGDCILHVVSTATKPMSTAAKPANTPTRTDSNTPTPTENDTPTRTDDPGYIQVMEITARIRKRSCGTGPLGIRRCKY